MTRSGLRILNCRQRLLYRSATLRYTGALISTMCDAVLYGSDDLPESVVVFYKYVVGSL